MPRIARLVFIAVVFVAGTASAADFPVPKEGDWIAKDVRFKSGDVLPEVRLHYTTIGAPTGEPVLILHGSGQSGAAMLAAPFAGELFGPGQPLDATKYFIVLPDAIGHGKSSKPSDGLRAKFPAYDYDDMVELEYRLMTEGLGIPHARLVLGNSMGGMGVWLMAEKHPDFMDIAVPMASQPVAMSGRNWMLRRLIVDSIRNDPDWNGGNYTSQPKSARFATTFFGLATSGGSQALYRAAPTREKADALVDQRLAAPYTADANDVLFQWNSSRTYDASADLEKITATLLAINSADDERNPPELGVMEPAIRRVRDGRVFLIPASAETLGHATTFYARWWKDQLEVVLKQPPRR